MSSEKKVRVTVEACGEVRAFECRCATVTTAKGDGSGDSCFVGPTDISDLFALACECTDTLGANPHGHADNIQTTDLDARREIRDMAAKLGVDADF